ncbi:MAG TPA: efflux RND transporter periplasmic adaptor subunit [Cyclobacteriaceae bacterium]
MNKRNLIIGGGLLVGAFIIFLFVKGSSETEAAEILANVERGTFRVEIETTGELEAKNSVKILGPSTLRDFRIWNVTIQNIVDEGTVVKKGDWVATLDRSEFQGRYNEKQIELEKAQSKYVQVQLDTTLEMRKSRDELINLKYGVEENRIKLEQSKFEPPATIKQAEIDVDKSKRAYDQALENYKIKKRQNVEKMREVGAELRKVQNEFTRMTSISESFNVTAPEPGMVIYTKSWDGTPIKAGSQINMWEPTVATLPDLTKMLSKTYVNEVDVRKVKAGQNVEIGLDAYPDKQLSGKVIRVANVGEQRPNSDAKVFLVDIEIEGTDPTLRPSMTTSNKVVAKVLDSVSYVPLEGLHSQNDSIIYVYKKDGINTVKQEVSVGETNSNDAVILIGLNYGDRIYLSVPPGMEDAEIKLLPQLDGKRKKDDEKEKKEVIDDKLDEKVVAAPVSAKN